MNTFSRSPVWARSGTEGIPNPGGIVWLASYPKSGNTWMRTLLANLVKSRGQVVSLQQLDTPYSGPIASSARLFESMVGEPFCNLNPALVDRLRPRAYRDFAALLRLPCWMKVHDAWRRTSSGEALFPPEVSLGCIYIVRNPLDVAVSMAPFFNKTLDESVDMLCDPGAGLCMDKNRLCRQLPQLMYDWSGHVESWIDSPIERKMVLRYEDMLADTSGCFRAVLDWSGIPYSESELEGAVSASDFRQLKAQEEKEGFRERGKSDTPFFRSGKAGGWREALTEKQVDRIVGQHGRVMRELGYLD
ncbi:sulfotransferase domain-containing protein [Niveibacterium terrae]|uniref:sulfotransferase domain-containing protein n=1 Tax=Niveibacterium terrae TaxID=3373598 RepID=UPI003A92E24C